MNFSRHSEGYMISKLKEKDLESILRLCCNNKIFYQFHPPLPTKESIIEDMEALPPGKTYEDKFYIGFWQEENLTAVMDLILGYPSEDVAFIGFFMVDISVQGHGVGSGIISDILKDLKLRGYQEVQLGIDRGNPQSEAFWTKNGFVKTGREYTDEAVSYVYMKKRLSE